MFIQSLRCNILSSNFQSHGCHASSNEASFDLLQYQPRQTTAAIFRRDSDSCDMPDAVLFNDSDGEGAHLVIFRPDLARNGIGIREQVTKRLALVCLAVDETAHIQLPQLVQIR